MKKINILTFITILLIVTGQISAIENLNARKGFLDLSYWDFSKDGILDLTGEWLFLPDIKDNDIRPDIMPGEANIMVVPGYWNGQTGSGKGIYWFFLKLKLPRNIKDLGFYLRNAFTAYEFYVDGKLIMQRGVIKEKIEETLPQFLPSMYVVNLYDDKEELVLAWKIANFHDNRGGPFYPIKIGTPDQLMINMKRSNLADYIIIGILFAVFSYHLVLWIARRKNFENLIFSLCCFFVMIRLSGEYNLLATLFNEPSGFIFELEMKMTYLGAVVLWYLLPLFYNTIFPTKVGKTSNKIILGTSILFSGIVLISNISIYSSILQLFQIVIFSVSLWVLAINIIAVVSKKEGSLIIFIGIIILFLAVINDILFTNNIIKTTNLGYIGFIAFIISQSSFLSVKFSKSLKNEEYLTSHLKEEVQKRTFELEEATRQKTDFFINLAHETKTPLTLISNYLEKYINKTNVQSSDLLIIKQNIGKLKNDMVNFLDTEKLESNQIFYDHDQICDLSALVESKNIIFKETAFQKMIELECEVERGLFLKVDPVAVDRILNNLLDNAVKYTEKGGHISVKLFQEEDLIKLIVSDTGMGISEEQKKYIFSPHHQLSHKKRNIQGLGMGLHITNKIVQQLKSTISVSSNLGEGSEFCVTFQKYEKKSDDVVAKDFELEKPANTIFIDNDELTVNEFDKSKKTIFIVEDNLQLVANLKKELEEIYNVYFSINGKEALEKLITMPQPDIIISDIMMDVMDGYEFREKIIGNEDFETIPFIFLTAKGSKKEKIKGLLQGAIDFISKPFELDELKEKIKNWLILIDLKKYKEDIELNTKHQKRLDNFIDEYHINLREKEILSHLLNGHKNAKIANEMYISINTVKKHVERIKKKVDVEKKEELIKCLYNYVYK